MSVLWYASVWRDCRTVFHHARGSAILAAVLLRLRLPRLLPISYFHHEESPELEEGHGEAQHGASRPCHQQGPNADILYPRQVIARLSPYPPITFRQSIIKKRQTVKTDF